MNVGGKQQQIAQRKRKCQQAAERGDGAGTGQARAIQHEVPDRPPVRPVEEEEIAILIDDKNLGRKFPSGEPFPLGHDRLAGTDDAAGVVTLGSEFAVERAPSAAARMIGHAIDGAHLRTEALRQAGITREHVDPLLFGRIVVIEPGQDFFDEMAGTALDEKHAPEGRNHRPEDITHAVLYCIVPGGVNDSRTAHSIPRRRFARCHDAEEMILWGETARSVNSVTPWVSPIRRRLRLSREEIRRGIPPRTAAARRGLSLALSPMKRQKMILALLVVTAFAPAQTPPDAANLLRQTSQRISVLLQKLRPNTTGSASPPSDSPADAAAYGVLRDRTTAKLHHLIDEYLRQAHPPGQLNAAQIRAEFHELLPSPPSTEEYNGPPFVSLVRTANGPTLLVGYMLPNRGYDSCAMIRAYRADSQELRVVTSTGGDFTGHGLFLQQLESPRQKEAWILAWGPRSGFNGTKARIRLYRFDGAHFRTVWAPPDRLDAKVQVDKDRIIVTRLEETQYYGKRQPPYSLRDTYRLTAQGVKKLSSRPINTQ